MLDAFAQTLGLIYEDALGPASRIWPVYLLATVVIAWAIYRLRRIEGSFLGWLVPRSMWLHPSHIVDLKLFLVGRALSIAGFFNIVFVGAVVAQSVAGLFPEGGLGATPPHPIVVAALLLMVSDFSTYWVHRVHHETHTLWPFHSLHHSAEVMTPITVYRKHPVYDLISRFVHGCLVGSLQGILLGLYLGDVSFLMLMGVNAGYVIFNMVGSNFRHSHIWLSYGRVLEHIFISPAQHQIHHSLAPRHHNKNYGEVLAIWDWMFGTLYVPERAEVLEYGLGDADGQRIDQPHATLTEALVVPVKDSARVVRKMLRRKPAATRPDHPVTPAE